MDTEYILDCSLQLGETTALENTVLGSPLGAYEAVRALVDSNANMPEHYLQNTVGACLSGLRPDVRNALALQSLAALDFALESWQGVLEHNVQVKAQMDLGLREAPRGVLALPAPLTQAVVVRQESDLNENQVRGILDDLGASMKQRFERDFVLSAMAIRESAADGGRAVHQALREGALMLNGIDIGPAARRALQVSTRRKLAEAQRKASKAKAAIKKATRLFENLGQDQHLRLFVSGQEVELSHPQSRFKFILKPLKDSGWLLDRTQEGRSHTPYELALFTKDDVFLANLCVYLDATPVLDQLLALTLFVQSGDELKVLEKANWFGFGAWSETKTAAVLEAYPSLERKLPLSKAAPPAEGQRKVIEVIDPAFQRRADHWQPFEAPVRQWVRSWMEPLTLAARPLLEAAPAVGQLLSAIQEPLRVDRHELARRALAAA